METNTINIIGFLKQKLLNPQKNKANQGIEICINHMHKKNKFIFYKINSCIAIFQETEKIKDTVIYKLIAYDSGNVIENFVNDHFRHGGIDSFDYTAIDFKLFEEELKLNKEYCFCTGDYFIEIP
ncbi:TPA: hypothetical protein DEP21_02955 [Patescibacteria group bacterium]|nr:hypothetical protein [Candidatus Gracilibacteria bacterium]